jgi:C2 domain of PTEN tumour-suppressor protein
VYRSITGARKLSAVGHLLTQRHAGRFMLWNLSEVEYDVGVFNDQVLTYSFPGSPSPPLGLLLKLFISIESWLKADSQNVAVLHCLTGKGRTSTVLAAFLCWMGEAQFSDIYEALEYIATCKHVSVDDITIPSQRRYASYFKNMLDGIRPSQPPLMLKRIIMSEAPRFAKGPLRKNEEEAMPENDCAQLLGCVPYIQVFKAGKLLHTAPASLHFQQGENELPFCRVVDGNISFNVNLVIQGDILVRARHLTPSKRRLSMFRAAFHTGYAPPNVMRLTKLQLDGACTDDRFVSDFFLDLLLEPVSAEDASKLFQLQDAMKATSTDKFESGAKPQHGSAVEASVEDSMLYGDSRFWDVIKNRMKENASTTASTDPLWGPTVGRRRESKRTQHDPVTPPADENFAAVEQPQSGDMLGTFSIGGEMEFLPFVERSEKSQANLIDVLKVTASEPKKDSLLEALMGALDDMDVSAFNDDNEVVVEFDNYPEAAPATSALSIQPNKTSINTETPIIPNPNLTATATISDDIAALLTEDHERVDEAWDALLSAQANNITDDDLMNQEIEEIDDTELTDLETFLSK